MKRLTIRLLAATAVLALPCANALAADLDQILYAPELKRTVPVEIGNGWYLRGDIGYSFKTEGEIESLTIGGVGQPVGGADIESDISGAFGVGYQFTDWARVDATVDYSEGDIEGGGPAFDAIGVMGNAYLDLGTFAGFTPYVGAGLGSTYVDWDAYSGFDGDGSWRFTYALMAGVSYDLSKSMKVDVGYRYSDVADGDIFGSSGGANGASDSGYTKHEIRAGLRYSLW